MNASENDNDNHEIEFKFSENFGEKLFTFGHLLTSGGLEGHFDPQTGYMVMKGGAGGSTLQTGYNEDFIKKESKYKIITGSSGDTSKFYVNDVLESESGFFETGIHYKNFKDYVIKTWFVNGGSGGFSYDPNSAVFIDESQGDGSNSTNWPENNSFSQDDIKIIYDPQYGGGGGGSRLDKDCNLIYGLYDGSYIGAYGADSGNKGTSRQVDSCTADDINGLQGKNGGGGGAPGKVQYSNTYGIGGKGGHGISYFYFKLINSQDVIKSDTLVFAEKLIDTLKLFLKQQKTKTLK